MLEPKPKTIEEARAMARLKVKYAAPLWGMNTVVLRRHCLRKRVPGAVKLGHEWFVTPEGMDALFQEQPRKKISRK